jgi:hypothetical protein
MFAGVGTKADRRLDTVEKAQQEFKIGISVG